MEKRLLFLVLSTAWVTGDLRVMIKVGVCSFVFALSLRLYFANFGILSVLLKFNGAEGMESLSFFYSGALASYFVLIAGSCSRHFRYYSPEAFQDILSMLSD